MGDCRPGALCCSRGVALILLGHGSGLILDQCVRWGRCDRLLAIGFEAGGFPPVRASWAHKHKCANGNPAEEECFGCTSRRFYGRVFKAPSHQRVASTLRRSFPLPESYHACGESHVAPRHPASRVSGTTTIDHCAARVGRSTWNATPLCAVGVGLLLMENFGAGAHGRSFYVCPRRST